LCRRRLPNLVVLKLQFPRCSRLRRESCCFCQHHKSGKDVEEIKPPTTSLSYEVFLKDIKLSGVGLKKQDHTGLLCQGSGKDDEQVSSPVFIAARTTQYGCVSNSNRIEVKGKEACLLVILYQVSLHLALATTTTFGR